MAFRPTILRASFVVTASAVTANAAGLPQLDPTWYPNQLLWLAISFVMLYVIVSRVIAPNVGGVLRARDAAIMDAIAEAEEAKRAAESSRGTVATAGAGARAKAAESLAAAQAENSREATAAMAKLDHDLARKTEQAQARIEDALLKAKSGLTAASDALAAAMVEKLLNPDADTSAAPKRRANG